jgi:hypothetical protein
MTQHIVITAFSIAAALASGFAAWFWFKSSLQGAEIVEGTQAPISGAQELHILDAKVGIYYTQAAMKESARLNKVAAIWSGIAAALVAEL